jgi:hypothetical protein
MTTWATLLSEIRENVMDTSSNPRWSDALIYSYVKDAVRDYSNYFPMRVNRAQLTLTNGVYPLPSDFIDEVDVECPKDTYLKRRQERPGYHYIAQSVPTTYLVDGGNLYLDADTSDEVLLTYYALHPVPADANDSAFLFTVPDRDIELIRIYVKAQLNIQLRSKQAQLDRFDPGSGRRDDNPLMPETNALMLEYQRKIAERIPGGSINLYRGTR